MTLGNTNAVQSCVATNQRKFSAEKVIHFSGLKNIKKPGARIFSEIVVCLDCVAAILVVPEAELRLLANDKDAPAR